MVLNTCYTPDNVDVNEETTHTSAGAICCERNKITRTLLQD